MIRTTADFIHRSPPRGIGTPSVLRRSAISGSSARGSNATRTSSPRARAGRRACDRDDSWWRRSLLAAAAKEFDEIVEDPVTGLAIRLIPGPHRRDHGDAKVERADERRRREAPGDPVGAENAAKRTDMTVGASNEPLLNFSLRPNVYKILKKGVCFFSVYTCC
jgi:hypothetical protein